MKEIWIARDEDHRLFGFKEKPCLDEVYGRYINKNGQSYTPLPSKWFPQVTFENSPVKLILESGEITNAPKTQVKSDKRRR